MAIVSQGNSVVLDVDATSAIWVKSTGNAEVTVNRGGTPEVSNVTTEVGRFGYYGEPFQLTIRSVTGQAEYQDQQFSIQPLTSTQMGGLADSSATDVALAVNGALLSAATQQQKVVLFGDSYTATQNNPPLGDTLSLSLHRFILGKLGNSVSVVKNAGVSGNTSAQMLARIDTDVIPFKSDWVFFNCGVNDFFGEGRALADVQADVTAIVSRLIADGRKILLFNCPPQVSSRSGFTAAKSQACAQYNNWLTGFASSRTGVVLADIYSAFVNWSDATNAGAVADYFAGDGIHLSTFGEIVAAEQAIKAINGAIGQDLSLLNSPLDAGIAGTEGLFIGTTGTNGTASSGNVATSYTSSRAAGTNGSIVNSKLPLRGQRQTVTLTATNGEVRTRLNGNLLTELTPFIGKQVLTKVLMRLRTTSGGVSLKDLIVKLYTAVGGTIYQALNGTTISGYSPVTDTQFDTGLVLLTLRPLTIESGVTAAGMYFELLLDSVAGGVVELDIFAVDIREV